MVCFCYYFFDWFIVLEKINIMSILKLKLDKAAQQFQIHNFKQSLTLYEDCLAFCYRTQQSPSLIYNIMSTKGALLCILGELDKAMSTLNQVIKNDSNHYLALMRRSQVYKKRGKLNRALKDLQMVSNFCPDNLQIASMRMEIQNMKSKSKNGNSSQQSESEQQLEEQQLNFSNLKKIDRKSCSIVVKQIKARKSRVTITGDTAFEYEREDDGDKSHNSTQVSKEQLKEKYAKTLKQIQSQKDVAAPPTTIVVKPNTRSKSILKNKTSIFGQVKVLPNQNKEVYLGRESKLIDKLKNIDGKVLASNHSIEGGSNKNLREVQFRKSIFASQQKDIPVTVQKKPSKQGRKSCLKSSSFEAQEVMPKERTPRRSKFEMLASKNIDGAVIKNRKSIDKIKQFQGSDNRKEDSSDDGSSHNIFGSNENLMISTQIRQKLGISLDNNKEKKGPKQRANGGKSILKKDSILIQSPQRPERGQSSEVRDTSQDKVAKKPKKSVMFTKSGFAG